MQTFQSRVIDEKAALDFKILKLSTFLRSKSKLKRIDSRERVRLADQLFYMRHYSLVLKRRIKAFAKQT